MLNRYIQGAGDANINWLRDLIDESTFYRDIRPEAGFIERKAALEEMNSAMTLDLANLFQDRFASRASRPAMHGAGEPRRSGLSGGQHPGLSSGCPGRAAVGRQETNSAWGLLGQHGFPTVSLPAGFTTHVFDKIRDAASSGWLTPDRANSGKASGRIMFVGRPFF